jgi:hypothetical protein
MRSIPDGYRDFQMGKSSVVPVTQAAGYGGKSSTRIKYQNEPVL